jgi:DHA2 family multidrug resistance protein
MAPIVGRLYKWVDSRLLIGSGIALTMLGYFSLSHLTLEVGLVQMLPGLLLTGAGMAVMFSVMSAAVMRTIPPPLLAAATGLYTLSRRIGGNIGYAFVVTQLTHRATFHRMRLVEHVTPYDTPTVQSFDTLISTMMASGLPPGVAEAHALKLLNGTVTSQATMMAYNDVFWLMGMLFVLSLPFLLLLGSRHQQPAPVQGTPATQPS